ncbi:hypothetical protein [Pelosinus propionicus]|uniref:Uncharacterized protein n=1 Tax=Pelosinus propionicus DSM 13327 TaxID=1123291 RepID=A0A1I4N8U8_9FIRM|nr:hypothetical protein [Pelosinus propionicus]SFM11717.1 hypothetical protein SAMN04490355_104228 [Pelosinus propionicus DSM 13327]
MPVKFREYPIIRGKDAKRFIKRREKTDRHIEFRKSKFLEKMIITINVKK